LALAPLQQGIEQKLFQEQLYSMYEASWRCMCLCTCDTLLTVL
jgi:hypothetical protein